MKALRVLAMLFVGAATLSLTIAVLFAGFLALRPLVGHLEGIVGERWAIPVAIMSCGIVYATAQLLKEQLGCRDWSSVIPPGVEDLLENAWVLLSVVFFLGILVSLVYFCAG